MAVEFGRIERFTTGRLRWIFFYLRSLLVAPLRGIRYAKISTHATPVSRYSSKTMLNEPSLSGMVPLSAVSARAYAIRQHTRPIMSPMQCYRAELQTMLHNLMLGLDIMLRGRGERVHFIAE